MAGGHLAAACSCLSEGIEVEPALLGGARWKDKQLQGQPGTWKGLAVKDQRFYRRVVKWEQEPREFVGSPSLGYLASHGPEQCALSRRLD